MSTSNFISYSSTNSFSDIVLDYIGKDPSLRSYYNEFPDIDGVRNLIQQRRRVEVDRQLLVSGLEKQYLTTDPGEEVMQNLELLRKENTFTITTAHQPNIFTGPLYFIYKILHVISIAKFLNREIEDCSFVPVFYLGSEDADLEELGVVKIGGRAYRWNTRQKGSVGRMLVDEPLIKLINEINGQLGVLPFGNEIIHHVRNCYSKGKAIEQATFEFVHFLFAKFGLIVVLPDNPSFKKIFLPVAEKEISEHFSAESAAQVIHQLSEKYKIQARGRDINLFYLEGDSRERIYSQGDKLVLKDSGKQFTRDELLKIFREHPDRISPNVLLRPLYQCMLLPDVVFTGGGGEIAYWLELKTMFEKAGIPFPVLSLRNSFLLLNEKSAETFKKLNLEHSQLFMKGEELFRSIVVETSGNVLNLDEVVKEVNSAYRNAMHLSLAVDQSLKGHVLKLEKQAIDGLRNLEKKIIRAEKKKFETERLQLEKLKDSLFPNGGLQERSENILSWYATFGPSVIDIILQNSLPFEHQFGILALKK